MLLHFLLSMLLGRYLRVLLLKLVFTGDGVRVGVVVRVGASENWKAES